MNIILGALRAPQYWRERNALARLHFPGALALTRAPPKKKRKGHPIKEGKKSGLTDILYQAG